jgi:hypothetical protein
MKELDKRDLKWRDKNKFKSKKKKRSDKESYFRDRD